MMADALLITVLGFVLISVLGIVLSRRMAMAAFSLFAFTLGLAFVYAILGMSMAFAAQLILYVGGVMVLILFALFLYGDPASAAPWVDFRTNFLKAVVLGFVLLITGFSLPWKQLSTWILKQQDQSKIVTDSGISETGALLATTYILEFEVLGLLLLASLIVAGWFVYTQNQELKP